MVILSTPLVVLVVDSVVSVLGVVLYLTVCFEYIVWCISGSIGLGYFIEERGFSSAVIDMVRQLVPATRLLWQQTKVRFVIHNRSLITVLYHIITI